MIIREHPQWVDDCVAVTLFVGSIVGITFLTLACVFVIAPWITKDERCARDMNPGDRHPCSLRQVVAWETDYLRELTF
jgi:hypothetical protein